MPNNALSSHPVVGAFLPPRTALRNTPALGLIDVHPGPVALSNPTLGITYQLWQVRGDANNIYLSAPNTPEFKVLPGQSAIWVALAFDQNGNVFIAWTANNTGQSYYYWFDTTIPGYRISAIPGVVNRVFACLDDNRNAEFQVDDVMVSYVRAGQLYFRQQRDRFGVEYSLGAAPGAIVQFYMSHVLRMQWAFQNTLGNAGVPPQEFSPPLGINEPS
jgi:hypothetical protein